MRMLAPHTIIVREAICMCNDGWKANDASYYEQIDAKLAELPQTAEMEAARRYCAAGPNLSSAKFAYPHLKERLEEMLESVE